MSDIQSQPQQSESIGGGSGRQSANHALRDTAAFLRKRAEGLEAIADALERCTPSGTEDGREGHPHIGVGSDAEIALWSLAFDLRR